MHTRFSVPWVRAILLVIPVTGIVMLLAQSPGQPVSHLPATSVNGIIPASGAAPAATDIVYGPPTATPLPLDQPAPDFSLMGLDGQQHSLREYRGHGVLLNFWATWCGPCRIEMPLLDQTYRRLKNDGLVIIGVNMLEDRGTVQSYVNELQISFPILLAEDVSVPETYGVLGLPTTILIDSTGVVRDKAVGLLTDDVLLQYLNDLFSSSLS